MCAMQHKIPLQPAEPLLVLRSMNQPIAYRIHDRVKRCVDFTGALLGLLLFTPAILIISLLVKLTSDGPVFFRQERISQGERVFEILKFRTMAANAEAKTGPVWSGANDMRVTRLGKLLRNTHLDELPQLWNVLMGDMSLVGPRPERPVFVSHFQAQGIRRYSSRHLAKTGITGYAQLQCPHPSLDDIQQKTDADIWYIEHWSLGLDAWIIARTFLYFLSSLWEVTNYVLYKLTKRMVFMAQVKNQYLTLNPIAVENRQEA